MLHIMTMHLILLGEWLLNRKNVFLCGGDLRSIYMARYFADKGCRVHTYGHGDTDNSGLHSVKNADVVVLGLPAVKDGVVNMPLCDTVLKFEELLDMCSEGAFVAGGRFTAQDADCAKKHSVTLADYSKDEIFQIENAFYTAEGAICALIENTSRSLCGMRILITGYGRISKAICSLLSSAPCRITVYARSAEQRAWCEAQGIITLNTLEDLREYDALINTVPADILPGRGLSTLCKEAIIIDLSARPGYVDKQACSNLGLNLIYLPGLPLTSAPCSAGETAARAIERMYFFTEGN